MIWKRGSATSICFEAFGVTAKVSFGDRALEPQVRAILPPGWTPADPSAAQASFSIDPATTGALDSVEPRSYDVSINGRPSLQRADLAFAIGLIDAELRMLIATRTPTWTFVHAGAVAVDGRAIVIPGRSFSGKTTLVQALVQAGATYYSDEFAVLDADGMVYPYPRRLSVRGDDASVSLAQDVAGLGAVAGVAAVPIHTVLVTAYRPDATWEPRVRSAGEGTIAMLSNTAIAQLRPGLTLASIANALQGARVLVGNRGEASLAARGLIADLRAASDPVERASVS